jgi:beta-lactamase regulating signal transducer with metallopeptidase domain
MNDFGWLASTWLLRTLAAGGVLLLLAWLALRLVGDPARRQRLAAWTIRGAVLTAVLGFFPAWLTIPVSLSEPKPLEKVDARTVLPPENPATAEEPAGEPAATSEILEAPDFVFEPAFAPAVEPTEAAPATATLVVEEKTESPSRSAEWVPWVLFAYGSVALLASLQLILAAIALVRLRRSSKPAPEAIVNLARELALPLGVTPQVRVSARIASPVCFGWRRPVVLLPQSLAETARTDELRWVLTHELDHLRRGDPRTTLWLGLARAVYFAVPWFWAVRRELRLAQEYLADAAAAAGRPADYAAFLVSLSGIPARRGAPLGAVAVRAGRTDLYRRVSMLTQSNRAVRDGCSRAWSLLTAGGVIAAAVTLSGIGFADDSKPEKKIEARVIINSDDDKQPEKKDGEKKTIIKKFQYEVSGGADLQALSKAVTAALEKGDVDAAKKAMAKLNEAIKAQPHVLVLEGHPGGMGGGMMMQGVAPPGGVPGMPGARLAAPPGIAPGAPGMPGAAPGWAAVPVSGDAVKKMEEKLASLKQALESVKDSPEAREALEKTIAEFRKKIEEARAVAAKYKAAEIAPGVMVWERAADELNLRHAKSQIEAAQAQFEVAKAQADAAQAGLERAMKAIEKQMSELKDNPEAAAALKAAADQLHKQWADGAKMHRMEALDAAARQKNAEADAVKSKIKMLYATQEKLAGDDKHDEKDAIKAQIARLEAQLKKLEAEAKTAPRGGMGGYGGGNFGAAGGMGTGGAGGFRAFPGGGVTGISFPPAEGRLGVQIEPVPAVLAVQFDLPKGQGVVISSINHGTPAEKAGLKQNDVMMEINGKPVPATPEDVVKLVNSLKAGEKFDVLILRKGQKETIKDVVIPVPKVTPPAKRGKSESDEGGQGTDVKFNSMSVNVNDGHFNIEAKNDDISIVLEGRFEDGKPVVEGVRGTRDSVVFSAKDPTKLSKSVQAVVEQLLKTVSYNRR